jgi:hypothetical protein
MKQDYTISPTQERMITEVCTFVLLRDYDDVSVHIEATSSEMPLLVVAVKLGFWKWFRFDPFEVELRLTPLLDLIARGHRFRIAVMSA